MSGTVRSTIDMFDEYEDSEIVSVCLIFRATEKLKLLKKFEALRRVHLITSSIQLSVSEDVNNNIFQSLESPVSEGGENLSAG